MTLIVVKSIETYETCEFSERLQEDVMPTFYCGDWAGFFFFLCH